MFPGSETKSLVKLVPSSRALKFNLFLIAKELCLPIKLIVILFLVIFDLYILNSYDFNLKPCIKRPTKSLPGLLLTLSAIIEILLYEFFFYKIIKRCT